MRAFSRVICAVLAMLAGLWLGAVVPLAVFLLTGLSPVVVSGAALCASLATAVAASMLVQPFRTPAVVFAVAAACGVVLQTLFTLAGGWTFGG